ncbi:MAG: YraN family protein [Actinomycetota bacterium]|nr:YraN family protein [Actinomycetota bacterium]
MVAATGSRALGRRGEDLAAGWYEGHGYAVVARNWRCRAGEIDLIVRRSGVVVFCEVKTRSNGAFGTPAEAVTGAKQARVRRLACRWLAGQPADRGGRIRFDVAAVVGSRVEILEAVF